MNKIAVVSMIRNEEDIVESSVRHWALFADKIFICDHKSIDRTREILDSLKSEGLPIEISTYDRDEKAQAEITTKLSNRAFDENFDIVLPLDVDEFPILVNGNSEDLRKCLQNLDTTKIYRIQNWEHRFADNDETQYALSRTLVKLNADDAKKEFKKIFVGRDFWIKHNPTVAQGNHGLKIADQKSNSPIDLDSIIYAHIPIRSENQEISKYATSWIATLLKYSRYTWHAIHCKRFVRRYVNDESVAEMSMEGFVPTDLSAYKNEVSLRFSGGGGQQSYTKTTHSRGKSRQYNLQRAYTG
ncbi:MAG: glycosyltransferase family 2 protein [Selenomonadaceae bacterium]|nr:glycosyltransferase family 2 protein [Selenomonadaceae bacterium]